jgi:N-acetylglucosaminyl-diphospho-decaprenol L-rhamnosyltransferase
VSVSIVIVAHRSRTELETLLPALPADAEVIVVDTDGSATGAPVTVIERRDNPGFGPANNDGVARAGGDVCVLLNPDIVTTPAAVERLATLAAGREALVVPRLLNADGSVQRSAFALPGKASAVLNALAPGPLRREPWRSREPRIVGWALAAALAAPTALLRRLGPFDPGAFLFYEDMDLCLRAHAAGIPTVLHPDVVVRHLGGRSTARAFGGEAFELQAQRRREVVGARLGARALRIDDGAQALTFGLRAAVGRERRRSVAALRALRAARRMATAARS